MFIAGGAQRTSDGGRTWQASSEPCQIRGDGQVGVYAGTALNPSMAWIVCISPSPSVIAVFRTQDGGDSWQPLAEFTPTQAPTPIPGAGVRGGRLSLHFSDARHGWFVSGGERSTLELTDDAGTSWRATPLPNDQTVVDAQFLDADSGWAAGGLRLWRTTDGGAHWQELLLPK
jgi:photosystem II stability/assembly factor-like uncharacterized protein